MRKTLLSVLVIAAAALPGRGAEVSALVKKLQSTDSDERRVAAKDLAEMGSEARPAVPALAKSLKDRDKFVRRFAAEALGAVGPDAREAVPNLKALLGDSKEVSEAAVVALGKIGGASVQPLIAAVKDARNDPAVRGKAAEALGKIGLPDARPAVKPLTDVLTGGPKAKPNKGMMTANDMSVEVVTALGELASASDTDALAAVTNFTDPKKFGRNPLLLKAAQNAVRKIKARTSTN